MHILEFKKINMAKWFLTTFVFLVSFGIVKSFANDVPSSPLVSAVSWPQFRYNQENTALNPNLDDPFFKKKWGFSLGNPSVSYSSPAAIIKGSHTHDGNHPGTVFIRATNRILLALKASDGAQ